MSGRPFAAVAYVERADGKILVVWNKRYGRWSMPGGKVEAGERSDEAVRRELIEETGSEAIVVHYIYEGEHGESVESSRGSYVFVFACTIQGEPSEREPGCPITWFTREEFMKWGLAPNFYRRMFETIPPNVQRGAEPRQSANHESSKNLMAITYTPEQRERISEEAKGKRIASLEWWEPDGPGDQGYWVMTFDDNSEISFRLMAELC